jgi:hypothetical protein
MVMLAVLAAPHGIQVEYIRLVITGYMGELTLAERALQT